MRETNTHIYFFSRDDIFSNFAVTPFLYEKKSDDMFGVRGESVFFQCSEQGYMYEKCLFFNRFGMAKNCIDVTDPRDVKRIGRSIPNFNDERWNEVSFDKMYDVLMCKFSNNKEAKEELINSGNKILVEASPYDKIWGCGIGVDDDDVLQEENWTGENRLGEVLMKVREDI